MALTRITKGVIKPNESYDTHNINSTGIITAIGGNITGNLSVGGVLTYEDVTSIDSVGIITAQQGIHVGAGVSAVGVISATSFVGSGANLTGVNADRLDGIDGANFLRSNTSDTMNGDLTLSGFSPDLNFVSTSNNPDWKITNYQGTLVVYDITSSANKFLFRTHEFQSNVIIDARDGMNVVGVATFQDIDVDGHTNLDNVSIAGVTTATGLVGFGTNITLQDNGEIRLGERVAGGNRTGDLLIRHDPSLYGAPFNVIQSHHGNIQIENRDTAGPTRFLYLKSNTVQMRSYTGNEAFLSATLNSDVKIYYDNSEKLATTNTGITVTGNTVADGLVIDGDSDLNGDLDVDGHTNLDNVSVAGVSTFSDRVTISGGKDLFMFDNGVIRLGNNSNVADLQIFHDGSHSRLNNSTGNLYLSNTTTGGSISLSAKSAQNGIIIKEAPVRLFYDNTLRFSTSGVGATVYGNLDVTGNTVHLYNNTDTSNTYFHAQNTGVGNAGIKLQNSQGEWTIIANDRLRFIDDDASAERLSIKSNGYIGINQTNPERQLHIVGSDGATGATLGNTDTCLILDNQGTNGAIMEFLSDTNGAGRIMFTDTAASNRGRIEYMHSDDSMRFWVNATERVRIENAPGIVVQNFTSGDGDNNAAVALQEDYNAWGLIFRNDWIDTDGGWGTFWAGSQGAAYRRETNDTNPNEYVFVGSGNKRFTFELNNGAYYSDGSVNGNNYDYAEYFEWEDGNPSNEDRRGYSVFVNSNGKIEKATDSTNTSDIIGAITGTAFVIGDGAVYDWQGKWKVDEWGTVITEDVKQVTWKDEDGKSHSYDEDKIPSGLTIPSDASYRQHSRRILNPDYDETKVYVPRDKRQEWDPVGLLGKVRVRDDSPKNPNWKYIKTINGKKLWLIR